MPYTRITIDSFTNEGVFSVQTQTVMDYNGNIVVLENNREALLPGDTVRAQEILPENMVNAVTALWTKEVVDAWNAKASAARAAYEVNQTADEQL